MRLLIAEDDPRLLKSLLHIFRANGYAADGVENGTDAYDYASGGEYDGLVLDIMMPGTDGLHVLSRLRAEGVKTPALFLTARADSRRRARGRHERRVDERFAFLLFGRHERDALAVCRHLPHRLGHRHGKNARRAERTGRLSRLAVGARRARVLFFGDA